MIDFLKFVNQSDEEKYNMLLEAVAQIHKLENEIKEITCVPQFEISGDVDDE